jgi:ribosomal protein L11 methyltransferase
VTPAQFILTCPARTLDGAQALADAIEQHPALDALAVAVNEVDEAADLWNTVAYFSGAAAARMAREMLGIAGDITQLPPVDWVRQSLQGLAPVAAGRFQLVGSHDSARRRPGGISLVIDAGTAFGTGHHGTTAGCLLLADAWLKKARPHRILDLGCGTGVLALAAAKVTARKVLASDIDAEAVRVTRHNAACNNLLPRVRAIRAAGLQHPGIRAAAPFDLVFANILARPLAGLAQGLSRLLAPGGIIILSGLTGEQRRWITACYRARGFVPLRMVAIENWVAVALQKTGINAKRLKHGSRRYNVRGNGPDRETDV